jgi:hypothetical protein
MVISGAHHLDVAAQMLPDLVSMLKKRASKYPRDQGSRKMMGICKMIRPTGINSNDSSCAEKVYNLLHDCLNFDSEEIKWWVRCS